MPYKGVGKSSFMLPFKEVLEVEQKYPVLIPKLENFCRHSFDVLTHQTPFGIWSVLMCFTTKLKVQSKLSLPFVCYLWFLKQPFMDEKREYLPERKRDVSSSYWWIHKYLSLHWMCVGVLKNHTSFSRLWEWVWFVMWSLSASPHCKQTTASL